MSSKYMAAFSGEVLTPENIYYMEMVDVKTLSGTACGCNVHFFNHKGVLVGRSYEFVPYSQIRRHPAGLLWELNWVKRTPDVKGYKKKTVRQWWFECVCKVITKLMRYAEKNFRPTPGLRRQL